MQTCTGAHARRHARRAQLHKWVDQESQHAALLASEGIARERIGLRAHPVGIAASSPPASTPSRAARSAGGASPSPSPPRFSSAPSCRPCRRPCLRARVGKAHGERRKGRRVDVFPHIRGGFHFRSKTVRHRRGKMGLVRPQWSAHRSVRVIPKAVGATGRPWPCPPGPSRRSRRPSPTRSRRGTAGLCVSRV